jgi:hypothetical protein
VKDHWYHLRLLRKGWSPVLKRTAKAAHEVSDLLGDEHDLAVLGDDLRANSGKLWEPARAEFIAAMAEGRRGELFGAAVPLGRRLYAEKPPRFTTRIRRYREVMNSQTGVQRSLTAAGA